MKGLIFVAFLALCCASLVVSASSLAKEQLRGVAPEDEKYYKLSDVITCKDGSGKFRRSQLNDDFCDCPDGTDEPGTSACPSGKFYCRNAGHSALVLFSSRVNDGICDCCDGSDEYDGRVKCTNTCWEAGKVARENLQKKIAMYKEGVAIRKREVEQVKTSLQKDKEELLRLKDKEKFLEGLVKQLQERKEQIEKAEEKERLQKEKEEKEKKEAEEKAENEMRKADVEAGATNIEGDVKDESEDIASESEYNDKTRLLDDSPLDQNAKEDFLDEGQEADAVLLNEPLGSKTDHHAGRDGPSVPDSQEKVSESTSETVVESGTEPFDQIPTEEDGSPEKTEGLSKEELGRLVASRWTGEKVEKEDDGSTGTHDPEQTQKVTHQDDLYASENDDDNDLEDDTEDSKYEYDNDVEDNDSDEDSGSSYDPKPDDDTDFSDVDTKSSPSWFDKIKQTMRNLLQVVNLIKLTPVDKSEAARIRQEYESSNSKLSKIRTKRSSLEEKLKHDFGPEKEFYSFYDRCFESKQNKYTYKVCPFNEATQEEGYSRTQLGSWDKFGDSYKAMLFTNGDKCWNGPDRSLKVKLRCGLTNEMTDVDEPSRCEYVAMLATPALCLEDRLKELQHKLDALNKQQPLQEEHDEL